MFDIKLGLKVLRENVKVAPETPGVYRMLDENGAVDVSKARPITFDPFNNKYVVLGDTVGTAFRDGKALK